MNNFCIVVTGGFTIIIAAVIAGYVDIKRKDAANIKSLNAMIKTLTQDNEELIKRDQEQTRSNISLATENEINLLRIKDLEDQVKALKVKKRTKTIQA